MTTSPSPPAAGVSIVRGLARRADRSLVRLLVVPVLLLAVAGTTYVGSRRPALDQGETASLAGSLAFRAETINAPGAAHQDRDVAPAYQHLRSWISAVGAAAAVADLAGTGRPAEICLVDPRDDSVQLISVGPSGAVSGEAPLVLDLPDPVPPRPFAPMGCVPGDLDRDGDEDLLVYNWGRPPVMFAGVGRAATDLASGDLVGHELVAPAEVWNSTALSLADVDGDGQLDMLVANYFPDGVAVLDPAGSGVDPILHDSMSAATNGGTNRLLLLSSVGPDQPPAVIDATPALPDEAQGAWTLALGFQDLTGDLLPEIYLANDFGPDHLLYNESVPGEPGFSIVRGDRTLTDPKSKVLGRDSFKGMGVTFSRLDGADLPTIFVSNITSEYALQESNLVFAPEGGGGGSMPSFHDRSEALGLSRSGWSWDIQAVDLNNDGVDELVQATGFVRGTAWRWPELQEVAMGNDGVLHRPGVWLNLGEGDDLSGHETDRLWMRHSSGHYFDVAGTVGFGSDVPARGMAVGDLNGDSLPDVVVANQWAPSVLYLNTTVGAGPAATLDLRSSLGDSISQPAVGAEVVAEAVGSLPRFVRQVFPANGHASVSGSAVLLPLPESGGRPVRVRWRSPNGAIHEYETVLDRSMTLTLHDDGGAQARG